MKHHKGATRAMAAGLPEYAVVGLRKTLEGAAAKFGVQGNNLAKSIEKLISQGFVTQQFGQALHHVRFVGNHGAHYSDEDVDMAEAQRALAFTTLVLRNLFEVPGELGEVAEQTEEVKATPATEAGDS